MVVGLATDSDQAPAERAEPAGLVLEPDVGDDYRLVGLITAKDLHKEVEFPRASKDGRGRLRVAAAIGTGDDTEERLEQVLGAGVDTVVVDTAHGHSS